MRIVSRCNRALIPDGPIHALNSELTAAGVGQMLRAGVNSFLLSVVDAGCTARIPAFITPLAIGCLVDNPVLLLAHALQ